MTGRIPDNPNLVMFVFVLIAVLVVMLVILSNQTTSDNKSTSAVSGEKPIPTETTQTVRKMAVAGTFYPADAGALKDQLTKYLAETKKPVKKYPVRILIAPHAGLDYSGPTAAGAFKEIEGEAYDKAIIIGPSHYKQFDEAALISSGEWETPSGNVQIDTDLAQKILSSPQNIISNAAVYDKEHSIEQEVIWLKQVLPKVKIVPILISQPSEELVSAMAFRIAANMDDKTLLVISSDLSHYPNYETAKKTDKGTIDAILSGSKTTFEREYAKLQSSAGPGVATLACGYEPIRVALEVATLLKLDPPTLLKYENSGDVTKEKNRVVGYGAIKFTGKQVSIAIPDLSDTAKAEAKEVANTTLKNFLVNKQSPGKLQVKNPELLLPLGAFVTIRKDGNLRGCVGEFDPKKPLYQVIQERTIEAATKDPRFTPVKADELSRISLEISVMSLRKKIERWQQIDLSRDGVVLIQGNRLGTFLPQVAKETKWKLEEYLTHLCSEKAGLEKDCYLNPATEFFTYQAQVF